MAQWTQRERETVSEECGLLHRYISVESLSVPLSSVFKNSFQLRTLRLEPRSVVHLLTTYLHRVERSSHEKRSSMNR